MFAGMMSTYARTIITLAGRRVLINLEVCVAHENLAKGITLQFNYELYTVGFLRSDFDGEISVKLVRVSVETALRNGVKQLG